MHTTRHRTPRARAAAGTSRLDGPLRSAALILALASALTACTSGGASPEPTATPGSEVVLDQADQDTCELLPAEDLAAVLGEETEPTPVPSGGWSAGQCSWSGPETGFMLSVGTAQSIREFADPAEPDAESKLAGFGDRQADAVRELEEVGDGAVAGPHGVAARVGGTYLELEALSLTPEQAEGVMRLAVENVRAS